MKLIKGEFKEKLELQFAPSIKAGFPSPAEAISLGWNELFTLLKEKVAIAQESRCLAELRDTLLPRLMSGELHVNDMLLSEKR